jgi:hypothetical protein
VKKQIFLAKPFQEFDQAGLGAGGAYEPRPLTSSGMEADISLMNTKPKRFGFLASGGSFSMVFLALLLGMADRPVAGAHSELWGKHGEKWSPESRLPDWSFAGFDRGESEPPRPPETGNVREFGARGDGMQDDTEAFKKALEAVDKGVIEIPAGRFVITDILEIRKPDIVLRGAGVEKTVLFFPKTLTDVRPNWGATTTGRRTSNYSWSGGFIRVTGQNGGAVLAKLTEPATRGSHVLRLNEPRQLQRGMEVMLAMQDDEEYSLTRYLYAGHPGTIDNIPAGHIQFAQVFRVVEARDLEIVLDRPLRSDVRVQWQPTLRAYEPTVTQVGIENVTFEFPAAPYEGHFTELGHNGIAMSNVAHCWVRNVRFRNAESGIFLNGRFSTIEEVAFDSERDPDRFGNRGHHGITVTGEDNLTTGFVFNVRYIHDITVTRGSAGNVFSNGRGVDLNFDHHRRGPYENLFSHIDLGKGARVWASGGGAHLGKHCAARGTFWNLRSENPIQPPPSHFAPAMINVVGVHTQQPGRTDPDGLWFEAMAPEELQPQDIHQAQRKRRLESR